MGHEVQGRVWLLPDDVEAARILSRRALDASAQAPARERLADIVPGLGERLAAGDILWAGENFGHGSTREEAPRLLKDLGVRLILATSFARIFYRNAINIGLAAAVGEPSGVRDGDDLRVHLVTGEVTNLTRDQTWRIEPIPPTVRPILAEGGLIPYIRRHGRLPQA
jgi:3-isopropylmalate/(R)-2-methylmalate dehydratase small subunit